MLCTVIDLYTKFATVLEGKLIGTSKHKDYSLFHFKAHDVSALKKPITKFVFVSAKGDIDEVILTEQLKTRGVNYKTAVRDLVELTDVELAEVSGAYELARTHLEQNPTPKVDEPKVDAPAEPAQDAPTEAAVEAAVQTLTPEEQAFDAALQQEADAQAPDNVPNNTVEDSLTNVKPSRSKRSR